MDELDPKDDELKEVELPESDDDGMIGDEDDDLLSGHSIKKPIGDDDDVDESLDALAEEEDAEEDAYDDVDLM